MSFEDVFPADPVIAITFARERVRASRPSPSKAVWTSSTIKSGAFSGKPSGSLSTSAAAAPELNACATKSCPSRLSRRATNKSPGMIVLVSIDMPVAPQLPVETPQVAFSASCHVQIVNARLPPML